MPAFGKLRCGVGSPYQWPEWAVPAINATLKVMVKIPVCKGVCLPR